jgi:Zn finger protein HypA/HybF involved in hydrogenase expression
MTLLCPECESKQVTLTAEQKFMANTGEHYCHSVKIQDLEAQAYCLDCGWEGYHYDLTDYLETS